jgi:site-specific recombinase XerD
MRPGDAYICALRLLDVDQEQGSLVVRRKGAPVQQLMLGHEGLHYLLACLDNYRLGETVCGERTEGYLFLSEADRPLTKSGITLLFDQPTVWAGIIRKNVGPILLRENFAIRYLQVGGDLCTL